MKILKAIFIANIALFIAFLLHLYCFFIAIIVLLLYFSLFFADDRSINPETDPICQIQSDPNDKTKLKYQLLIKDLEKCGVLVKNVSKNKNKI